MANVLNHYNSSGDFHSIPVTKPTTGKWRRSRIPPQNYICPAYPATPPIKWCIWKKPEIGWIKLNTDGSFSEGYSAIGGLLRDYRGEPLCAFFTKAFHDNTFIVELSAIGRGIHLALSIGIRAIWIESDSLSVVKTINGEQPVGPSSSCYLSKIRKLLANFESYSVTHSWREANKAVDYVSRMHLGLKDVVLWPVDFPDLLHKIIMDDAQGKIYFRD